ncbi:alpha/beta hydrolase [Rhizobium leucaenae]|uniref:Pimeloyl-ACP methyl ester carboxylesterase n=1 Tax=Rhizobium leucaenae TaxID=29450 RepID=A0A7W6ZX49_9HYPH|nr:alpha/beta hydrolase [Rhizobium leucaenae]MBB4569773.1 pimeloyl-ACP methyl ester carboxylesterase [Rhizobium leucaenae]MBB6299714.1 pimeloyl-ACP methyl ester carboxylesterase [Rhizobium leucaenae]
MPSFALKVTRLGMSSLNRISPRLAGKAAFKLFCLTPSRRPQGAKAEAAYAEGRARLNSAEQIMLSFQGGRAMAYRLNGGAKGRRKRFLVVHGWGSSSEYMSELSVFLANTGAEVISLDLPGHGRSPGRFLNVRLAVSAIAAAAERFGAFDATIGHSFGGASIALAASGFLPRIEPILPGRLVLIGAPSAMGWLFTDFGGMMGLDAATQAALEAEVGHVTGRPLKDYDAGRNVHDLRRPVLVIHAEDDKEVSADHARAYATAGDHVRLFWANGFGHRRIVSAAPVLAAIGEFLAEAPAFAGQENALETDDETVISFHRTSARRVS